jgi:hypothetical protein
MLPKRGEIWLVNLDPIYEKLLVRLQLLLSIKNRTMKPDFNLRSIVTPESIDCHPRIDRGSWRKKIDWFIPAMAAIELMIKLAN